MSRNLFLPLLLLVIFIAFAYLWARRRGAGSASRKPRPRARESRSSPRTSDRANLSAEQAKVSVAQLLKANAQWPQIIAALNPQNDVAVAAELSRIRGPHMFVPHLALQVIQHGCEESIRVNKNASFIAAATAARVSMEKVTRYGD